MSAVVGAGGDELVGLHVDADAQHALGLLWRLPEGIAVGGRCDTDLGGGLANCERCGQRAKNRRSEKCAAHNSTTYQPRHELSATIDRKLRNASSRP